MRVIIRTLITLFLLGSVLLVKHHIESIESKWQSQHSADISVGSENANGKGTPANPAQKGASPASPLPLKGTAQPAPTNPDTIPIRMPNQGSNSNGNDAANDAQAKPPKPKPSPMTDRIIVTPATTFDDVDWLENYLPEWQHAVYSVDDDKAPLTVKKNKGKESNVYLQYIIDHYYKLPQFMVFLHAHHHAHHVEFDQQSNPLTVERLQLGFLNETGYVSMRCDWEPGCPAEVQPFRQLDGRTTELAFAGAWIKIFNDTNIPEVVAAPCCAQFATTRTQVHARPLSHYVHFQKWLYETELDDETSGRVFEYLWHIIFGKDPVFCPTKRQCYADVYGLEFNGPSKGGL